MIDRFLRILGGERRVHDLFRASIMALALNLSPAVAGEYFVALDGSDAHDGKSITSPLRTIQKGVDALQKGDTLIIAPGEYQEAVAIRGKGGLGADTLIRAKLPGTVTLRGDVPIQGFQRVPGTEFTWVATCDQEPHAVNELDTLISFTAAQFLEELEYAPQRFFYRRESKQLYISTSDLQSAETHSYAISVINRHGISITESKRIIIEGIGATGFNTNQALSAPAGTAWGFWVQNSVSCRLVDCTAFLNGGGIATYSRRLGKGMLGGDITGEAHGGHNVIEHCKAFANYSKFSPEGGNIAAFQPNSDEIRECRAFLGKSHGIRLYGNHYGPSKLVGSIAWGHDLPDLWVKGRDVALGAIANSIALGTLQAPGSPVSDSLVGERNRSDAENTIELSQESRLNQDLEFADPENLDFRLQSTSRFRKKGSPGTDRGPFAYQPGIHYVKPEGDDSADGLSVQTAWRTLEFSLKNLKPGQTLYLNPGTYDQPMVLLGSKCAKSLAIRGRSAMRPVIKGDVLLDHAESMTFENLVFEGAVKVKEGKNVQFKNCTFHGPGPVALEAKSTNALQVTHCAFSGFAEVGISLENSPGAFLSSNLFNNREGTAIKVVSGENPLYSDYNGYGNVERARGETGEVLSLEELQSRKAERYSRAVTGAVIAERIVGGRLGLPLGPYREKALAWHPLRMTQPKVHSVSSTTANIEWRSSQPATYHVAWGTTPECSTSTSRDVDCFASLSLAQLAPGQKYYFKISKVAPFNTEGGVRFKSGDPEAETTSFITNPVELPPRNWHVATTGNDSQSGSTLETAWRTLSHAANKVGPGDTVTVHEGIYTEHVRLKATGIKEGPITFKAAAGAKVVLNGGNRSMTTAFTLYDKSYVNVDGFYFTKFAYDLNPSSWPLAFAKGVITIYNGEGIRISRCFSDGRGGGPVYPPPFIKAYEANNVFVKNSVIISGFVGLQVDRTQNFRLRNCVIIHPMVHAGVFNRSSVDIRNCIITDNKSSKAKVWVVDLSDAGVLTEDDNCFVFRVDDTTRKFLSVGPWNPRARRLSLSEFYQQIGKPQSNSVFKDPQFALLEGKESKSFPADQIANGQEPLSFESLFTTDESLQERKIGLIPEDFSF